MTENAQQLKEERAPVASDLKPFAGGWEEHCNRHCIWIVTPEGYKHSHAFDEVADALSGAFSDMGGSAPVVRKPASFCGRLPIIYGANLLPQEIVGQLPPGSIVANLEQVSNESDWFQSGYVSILKNYPVLDYSPRNCRNLIANGIQHAELLEIGYHAGLRRIRPAAEKDIDILFYGSTNDRRNDILNALKAAGLNIVHLFGVYGAERDQAIARAKVVLNMHYYSSAVFEAVRVSYLLSNGVCVLTEGDPEDPDIAPYKDGMAVEPYDRLVDSALSLVANQGERMMLGVKGWDAMRRRPQAKFLQAAMKG